MSLINKALKLAVVVACIAIVVKWLTLPLKAFISTPDEEYDFIIVGGGTAGSVLASRLSQYYRTLLIEAGGEFGYISTIPLAAPFLQGTDEDWQYKTEKQYNSSWGLIDQRGMWPRGKGLGGSGQLNYLLHYGGRKEDWDGWTKNGAEGWTQNIIAHYKAKLTGARYREEELTFSAAPCQGSREVTCGKTQCVLNKTEKMFVNSFVCLPHPQPSTFTSRTSRKVSQDKPKLVLFKEDPRKNPLLHAFIGSAEELKHLKLNVARSEVTVRNGRRWSNLNSHVLPAAAQHTNLHILLNTRVKKIVFREGSSPIAEGVEIVTKSGVKTVRVRREVVVSAGAIGSPQLLQLSGVGPKKLLERFQIDVIADRPVGDNLFDHLNVPLYVHLEKPVSLTIEKTLRVSQVLKYLALGKGAFTTTGIAGTLIAPGDVGLLLFGMGSAEEKILRVISNYKPKTFSAIFTEHKNHSAEGFILLASCLQPLSRGYVRINSGDYNKPPAINPNYLHIPRDIACTRRAIKLAKRLIMTEPFKKLGAKLHLPVLEECLQFEANINDNDYLDCVIRTVGITGYHPAGTVSMGNQTHSILDSSFRVRGVGGIRVVDASTFPIPFSGTPNSLLTTIAERASNLIIAETKWNNNSK